MQGVCPSCDLHVTVWCFAGYVPRILRIPWKDFWGGGRGAAEGEAGRAGSLTLTPGCHLFHTRGLRRVSLEKRPYRKRVKFPAEQISVSFGAYFPHIST